MQQEAIDTGKGLHCYSELSSIFYELQLTVATAQEAMVKFTIEKVSHKRLPEAPPSPRRARG
jgi:hypothetical protein